MMIMDAFFVALDKAQLLDRICAERQGMHGTYETRLHRDRQAAWAEVSRLRAELSQTKPDYSTPSHRVDPNGHFYCSLRVGMANLPIKDQA